MPARPARRAAACAVLVALGCVLVAGCGDGHGTSGTPVDTPSATGSSAPGSSASDEPGGLAELQKKVDAAESAVAAADRDAARDDDGPGGDG